MEYFWWLYLATRLDSIKIFFGWGIAFCFILGFGSLAVIFLSNAFCSTQSDIAWCERVTPKLKPWRKWGIIGMAIFSLLSAITPSKRDAMFIAGGIGVMEAAKAVQGSEIAKKSVAIVEQWLSNNLTELQKKEKKLKE